MNQPGMPDAAIERYWSFQPFRFTEVEWLELRRPVPWTNDSTTTLRMQLRDPQGSDNALLLEFRGVGELQLNFQGIVQVTELTIESIADRGWESERYAVDTPAIEQLKFYCREFSSDLVHQISEG